MGETFHWPVLVGGPADGRALPPDPRGQVRYAPLLEEGSDLGTGRDLVMYTPLEFMVGDQRRVLVYVLDDERPTRDRMKLALTAIFDAAVRGAVPPARERWERQLSLYELDRRERVAYLDWEGKLMLPSGNPATVEPFPGVLFAEVPVAIRGRYPVGRPGDPGLLIVPVDQASEATGPEGLFARCGGVVL